METVRLLLLENENHFSAKKSQGFPSDIQTKTGLVNETLSPVFGKTSEIAYNSSRYRSLCQGLVA